MTNTLGLQGLFEDLYPWIERAGIRLEDEFYPRSYSTFTAYGELWTIPTMISTRLFFFNPDSFDAAGLERPTHDWTSDAWTWDDFVMSARLLTQDISGDGRPDRFGLQNMGIMEHIPFIWGQDFIDPDFSSLNVTEELVQTLQRALDLWHQYNVVGGSFTGGSAAMRNDGNWALQSLSESGISWDVGAHPKGTQRGVVFYPNGLSMGKDSQHKEAVWEFIRYVTTDIEGIYKWMQITDRIPASRKAGQLYLDIHTSRYPNQNHQVWLDALNYGVTNTFRDTLHSFEIETTLNSAWARALRQETDIRSALLAVKNQVDALLAEHRDYLQSR